MAAFIFIIMNCAVNELDSTFAVHNGRGKVDLFVFIDRFTTVLNRAGEHQLFTGRIRVDGFFTIFFGLCFGGFFCGFRLRKLHFKRSLFGDFNGCSDIAVNAAVHTTQTIGVYGLLLQGFDGLAAKVKQVDEVFLFILFHRLRSMVVQIHIGDNAAQDFPLCVIFQIIQSIFQIRHLCIGIQIVQQFVGIQTLLVGGHCIQLGCFVQTAGQNIPLLAVQILQIFVFLDAITLVFQQIKPLLKISTVLSQCPDVALGLHDHPGDIGILIGQTNQNFNQDSLCLCQRSDLLCHADIVFSGTDHHIENTMEPFLVFQLLKLCIGFGRQLLHRRLQILKITRTAVIIRL